MPAPFRAPGRRFALATAAFCGLTAACGDSTGPAMQADQAPPPPSFAVAVPAVPISASTTSTTGAPVLQLIQNLGSSGALHEINEGNWVVGSHAGRAVLWRGGEAYEIIPRPTSAATTMRGFGLNDNGMVVGEWVGTTGSSLGFRWDETSGTSLLPVPPVFYFGAQAEGRDVDEFGNILVHYDRDNTDCSSGGANLARAGAVLRPPYGNLDYEQIRTPFCQNEILGQAMDGGVVVGVVDTRFASDNVINAAFSWDGGPLDPATDLTGDWTPRALAGDFAAGNRFISFGVAVAVRWTGGMALEDLGTLGGASSVALGVNNLGWVVGHSLTAEGETHAFLWTPESGMLDLGTLGGAYSSATDVNDQGNIIGAAEDAGGLRHGVIWVMGGETSPNEAPIADAGGPYVAAVGQPLSLDGTGSSDPDGDLLTYNWTLSDGSTATGATGTLTAPLAAGLYGITLLVSDPDGASSSASVEVAVYDPAASAVTGGGWFHSPAGALATRPEAEGRARFALHVAYQKGRSTPDGHARLSFRAGELDLKSGAFDWLVVGGEMARVRGSGTLEGRVEPVRFEVVLRTPDRIRVRIWDDSAAIYDSQEVTLGGGLIRIRQ